MDTNSIINKINELKENIYYNDLNNNFSFSYFVNLFNLFSTKITDENYEQILFKTCLLAPNRCLLYYILKNYNNTVNPSIKSQKYIDIIDNFIKEEPKIHLPSIDELPDDIDDLTENIKLDDEDFVSETFAFIFTKQKKFEKAIEIYDKLKCRYPEKIDLYQEKINEILKLQQN
jgi:tetratricopeptide (TPR) repeat protein